MKKLVMGADHAGYALKDKIKATLSERGYEIIDVGTFSAESCKYPLIAHDLCKTITDGKAELGILICGTGVGMSMCANKHKGIRAACTSDTFSARLTRMHNDANVLCFGERVVGYGLAMELVDAFIETEFEGGRHAERVSLINAIENEDFDALK
ncbi:MAG: ribose 5-phosphate isomerase B [Clostridia bacterium]|nr:ribose 5-phosphate isomerase B [Clostridia bacterium]